MTLSRWSNVGHVALGSSHSTNEEESRDGYDADRSQIGAVAGELIGKGLPIGAKLVATDRAHRCPTDRPEEIPLQELPVRHFGHARCGRHDGPKKANPATDQDHRTFATAYEVL